MLDAPYALALSAGLLAAVNPCGFALLPAYLSFLVIEESRGRFDAVVRALTATAAMTAGFVVVFGAFGLLAAPAADSVARNLPWLSIGIGALLVLVGGWLLAGRQLPYAFPRASQAPQLRRRFGSMAVFGGSYAIASLGCTIGPFLAVVVSGFRAGSVVAGFGLFVAYALGMGLAIGVVALAVALAKVSVVAGMRRVGPLIGRVGGGLVLVVGLYVAWYGWYEIRVNTRGITSDPIVDGVAGIQSGISGWLERLGPATLAIVFAVLLTASIGTAVLVRQRRVGSGGPPS